MKTQNILMLCDFACTTGFAQVSHNIVEQLFKEKDVKYKVDIIAINYFGDPNKWQTYYPQIKLYPAMINDKNKDPFGRQKYLDFYMTGKYDIVFILQDTFNLTELCKTMKVGNKNLVKDNQKVPKSILYFPIDCIPKKEWVNGVIGKIDQAVVYTQYGYDEIKKISSKIASKLHIAPHGTNTKHFHPLNENEINTFKQQYFNNKDKKLIVNVNRNQHRKDLPSTLKAFKMYLEKYDVPAMLYLHCMNEDVGHNLHEVAAQLDLKKDVDYMIPEKLTDLKIVNLIYNAADVVVTSTHGEGWGLSITEAMATKTPVIAHSVTSIPEILEHGLRGFMVKSNGTVFNVLDNNRERPQIDLNDFVDTIEYVLNPDNQSIVTTKADIAYQYTQNNTWDNLGPFWRDLFKNI